MKTTLAFSNTLSLYPFGKSQILSGNANKTTFLTFEEFTPTPMKENNIKPPQRVWENIAKILDEQDRQRMGAQSASNIQMQPVAHSYRKYLYGSVLLGIAIIACWYFVRA